MGSGGCLRACVRARLCGQAAKEEDEKRDGMNKMTRETMVEEQEQEGKGTRVTEGRSSSKPTASSRANNVRC